MSGQNEITLKVAEPRDAQGTLKLLQQINQETNVVMIDHLGSLTIADEQDYLHEINLRSDCLVLLAVQNERPVGIVTVTKIDEEANAGELGIAVLKQLWSQGIGTMLVNEATYWFKNYSSLDHLVLDVFKNNQRALTLYRKTGFVQTSTASREDSCGKQQSVILMEYQN
ncbi:GNAT family N-acetyltransferase [uncultured Limosilactobacillus sp.]|uniref:GNAT family N-acetyltransferase n=1 Tax=uncultured Limosilactobacillus sp. TaxID=2837629 RepID=UPI0025F33584|nr:GNAT family N-acetyltransferase [uncultured Limosilactobacillus sp.]